MSRQRLCTQSRGATSRLVIFPFYDWTKKIWDTLQRLRASFVDREWTLTDGVAFAAFNRKRSWQGPNWDSTHEDVERKPKGVKSSSRCMNSRTESVVPPTPQARQNGYTSVDRTTERTWHPNAKAEHRIATSRKFTNSNGNCACRQTAQLV